MRRNPLKRTKMITGLNFGTQITSKTILTGNNSALLYLSNILAGWFWKRYHKAKNFLTPWLTPPDNRMASQHADHKPLHLPMLLLFGGPPCTHGGAFHHADLKNPTLAACCFPSGALHIRMEVHSSMQTSNSLHLLHAAPPRRQGRRSSEL